MSGWNSTKNSSDNSSSERTVVAEWKARRIAHDCQSELMLQKLMHRLIAEAELAAVDRTTDRAWPTSECASVALPAGSTL